MAGPMIQQDAGVTNQIPASGGASSSGGMDLISSMLKQNQAIDQEITNTLPSAMTPVKTSGVSSPTLPGAFKFNPQSMPQQAAQGHADAVHKGVAKIVAGVTGLVGKAVQAKQAEKTRVLAADITKVMEAQDGISKAQEVLKNDPSNKEATEAVKKNTQIINDIAAEPKKLKQLEKAFSIDHVNPENNQHLEGDAMKMASKSFAERLSAQTPDKLVPNTLAIAKVQALQAQKKENLDNLKAIVPAINNEATNAQKDRHDAMVAQSVAASNTSKEAIEVNRAATQVADTKQRGVDALKVANANGAWGYKRAVYTANAAYQRGMDMTDERAEMAAKFTDPAKKAAYNKQTAALLQKELAQYPTLINQLDMNHSKDPTTGALWWKKPADANAEKEYQTTRQLFVDQQKDLTERLAMYSKTGEFPTDKVMGANNGNDQRAGSENSGSSAGATVADPAPDDLTNPNNSIYDSPSN